MTFTTKVFTAPKLTAMAAVIKSTRSYFIKLAGILFIFSRIDGICQFRFQHQFNQIWDNTINSTSTKLQGAKTVLPFCKNHVQGAIFQLPNLMVTFFFRFYQTLELHVEIVDNFQLGICKVSKFSGDISIQLN